MKKTVFFLSVIFLSCALLGFFYLYAEHFRSPIRYQKEMIIRSDNHGDGYFAASRSGNRMHNGIDLFAKEGEPVFASRSGVVVFATEHKGLGKYVEIRHLEGFTTIYGHLSEIDARKGQFVLRGQMVGKVGRTGNARSPDILPHLHFELRQNNLPLDPLLYLE